MSTWKASANGILANLKKGKSKKEKSLKGKGKDKTDPAAAGK